MSYKFRKLKQRELRARPENAQGPAFDLHACHNEVLSHGSVSLGVFDAAVNRGIAAQRKVKHARRQAH
ncbi:MAG: hypothetical protein V4578_01230 [Pseudomonadota bacterium]